MESNLLAQVPESHRDLLYDPLPFVLTTVDSKCRPQSSVVWILVDDDGQLKGSTLSDRQKYRNLKRNPACTLLVIDPTNDHRTLEIRAVADLVPDPEKETARAIAPKYGADPARLGQSPGDRVTIIFHPERVVTVG
jgi:PPOX class probable F420-dependent enzyme